VDVNSAFLAWEAVWRLQHGDTLDLREIPSVVGGDQSKRHGIVLAKSTLAKKLYKARTGEPLYGLLRRAPNITVVPPTYGLYSIASNAFMEHLKNFSPVVERFSIDEAFVDYTGLQKLYGDPLKAAHALSKSIKEELGFTVNIGVSNNKLLAKMAGELEKPDKVHTMWPDEIKKKLWPLPIGEMYMVGRQTEKKLLARGIKTVGDLAKYDARTLQSIFKSYGVLLHNYANGRYAQTEKAGSADFHGMLPNDGREKDTAKSIGNSTTIAFDVEDLSCAHRVLLSLSETVGSRLRENGYRAKTIHVSYCTSDFKRQSRQKKYETACASTGDIYNRAVEIFDDMWDGKPLRQMGVCSGSLSSAGSVQVGMFDMSWKREAIDSAVDKIRMRYGDGAAFRAVFVGSDVKPMIGGTGNLRRFPYQA
jgi:DNA polymerase-4